MRPASRALAACVLLAGGCGRTDWMGAPSGPQAREIATLSWVSTLALTAVVIVVYVILAYLVARRRRGTLVEHMPYTTKGGMAWIYTWGLGIPIVLFFAGLIASIVVMFTASEHMHEGGEEPDIVVTGHQWWWEVRYTGASPHEGFLTANEIHIPVGRPVLIRLRSSDVIHSFWVPQLSGKVDLVPGRDNTIVLQADTPGRYDGQCAEFCGAQHGLMRLIVIADNEVQYQAWRFLQHAPALIPRNEPEVRGLEVFATRACGVCHTVRGTDALGTVGPDLTHVGSRLMIGASSFPNNRAHVQGWIVRAQSLKSQVLMPNLFELDGVDINALAIYLRSLQ